MSPSNNVELFYFTRIGSGNHVARNNFPTGSRHPCPARTQIRILHKVLSERPEKTKGKPLMLLGPNHQNISRTNARPRSKHNFVKIGSKLAKQNVVLSENGFVTCQANRIPRTCKAYAFSWYVFKSYIMCVLVQFIHSYIFPYINSEFTQRNKIVLLRLLHKPLPEKRFGHGFQGGVLAVEQIYFVVKAAKDGGYRLLLK